MGRQGSGGERPAIWSLHCRARLHARSRLLRPLIRSARVRATFSVSAFALLGVALEATASDAAKSGAAAAKLPMHCAPRCGARSRRRDGAPCRAPAIRGRARCRMHGGRSTGPRTAEGLERCRKARWIHGRRSREAIETARAERQMRPSTDAERRVTMRRWAREEKRVVRRNVAMLKLLID